MVKLRVKATNRGGFRIPSKRTKATQRLLKVIWEREGGFRHLERVTGINAQSFVHWRNRGKVSLKSAGFLSRKLNYPIQAFNYEEVGELLSGDMLPWEDLIDTLDLSKDELSYVNKGRKPNSFKE